MNEERTLAPGAGEDAGASYDAVPYQSHAISETDPDALATMGTLFGMPPAAIASCRVLELGCAGGENLVAMALPLPGARFFGVDASAQHIARGRELVRALGVGNVELRAGDLQDLQADLPEFDFIICHGVYSWVPPAVQEKILDIFERHLAPQGIAYLSYNALPGSHLRSMVAEMMRYHVRDLADPIKRVEQSRALFDMLRKFAHERSGPYDKILEYMGGHIEQEPDWYVFHEYLEEHNLPVYFSEVVARAGRHGLQYLANSRYAPWEHRLPAEIAETFRGVDRVVREQYLDFLGNRMFRCTLFCRAGVPLSNGPRPEAVAGLLSVARARPALPDTDVRSDVEAEFHTPTKERVTTNRPLFKAALVALAERAPRAVPLGELRARVAELLAGVADGAAGPQELGGALLQLHLSNAVSFRSWAPDQPFAAGERPTASRLARHQVSRGELVVNLRHERVSLSDLDEVVLELLDGSRGRSELLEAVIADVAAERLDIRNKEGERVANPKEISDVLASAIEESLEKLAAGCLLTA